MVLQSVMMGRPFRSTGKLHHRDAEEVQVDGAVPVGRRSDGRRSRPPSSSSSTPPIPDDAKAAVERALVLTIKTNPPVEGSWALVAR